MSLEKLIEQRIDRLESVPDKLQTVIDKQDEKLFKQILKDLGALETKDGKIVASKDNLSKINAILENLKKTLFASDYLNAIKDFAGEIATQATLNNNILELTVGSFQDDEMFKATVKSAQHNALLLMDENAVAHNFLQPISELLTNSIVSNVSFTDAVESLRANMVGETALLSKYAKGIIKDTFSIADSQYTNILAKKHGIEFFRYDGGHIADTRLFCNERYGKIFHRDEIAKWGSGINTDPSIFSRPKFLYENKQGVKIYWEGMDYDTNSATIFSYKGGYTCQHALVMIATDYVPQSDKDRAKSLGFYTE